MSELCMRIYQKVKPNWEEVGHFGPRICIDQLEGTIQEIIDEETQKARDEIRELVTGLHRTELANRLGIEFGADAYEYLTWEELLNRVSLLRGQASVGRDYPGSSIPPR